MYYYSSNVQVFFLLFISLNLTFWYKYLIVKKLSRNTPPPKKKRMICDKYACEKRKSLPYLRKLFDLYFDAIDRRFLFILWFIFLFLYTKFPVKFILFLSRTHNIFLEFNFLFFYIFYLKFCFLIKTLNIFFTQWRFFITLSFQKRNILPSFSENKLRKKQKQFIKKAKAKSKSKN